MEFLKPAIHLSIHTKNELKKEKSTVPFPILGSILISLHHTRGKITNDDFLYFFCVHHTQIILQNIDNRHVSSTVLVWRSDANQNPTKLWQTQTTATLNWTNQIDWEYWKFIETILKNCGNWECVFDIKFQSILSLPEIVTQYHSVMWNKSKELHTFWGDRYHLKLVKIFLSGLKNILGCSASAIVANIAVLMKFGSVFI